MLNHKGFDLWADSYDQTVNACEESNEYPFAGYRQVLGEIYRAVREGDGRKVLDIGFGTGVLAKKLYDNGYTVYGIDFSEKMVEIAREKMPQAVLLWHNFSKGFPALWEAEIFDTAVCTYAVHHLNGEEQVAFLGEVKRHLTGPLFLGDVAFETVEERDRCREAVGEGWDAEECYPVAELLRPAFPELRFQKITHCSGILVLQERRSPVEKGSGQKKIPAVPKGKAPAGCRDLL